MSLAGEAETVDHRLIAGEAKQARARLTCLRQWRDRAYLGEAETQTQDGIDNFAILIKTRREPERVRKIETESADREARVVWRGQAAQGMLRMPEWPIHAQLGIEPEQNRTRQRIQKPRQAWPGSRITIRTGTESAA